MRSTPTRTIAIGDVHGHSAALRGLLSHIAPRPSDLLIFLGDYIDQGPDSSGVLDLLIRLKLICTVVALIGNHEELALAARESHSLRDRWLEPGFGGRATLASYGDETKGDAMPEEHVNFLRDLSPFYEVDSHFFIHANYAANMRLPHQDPLTARWLPLTDIPGPHYSGKVAVVGHRAVQFFSLPRNLNSSRGW